MGWFGESSTDKAVKRHDSSVLKLEKESSEQGKQLQNLKSEHDSLSSQSEKMRVNLDETKTKLEKVVSDATNFKSNQNRISSELSQVQAEQNSVKTALVRQETQVKENFKLLEERQLAVNKDFKKDTADMKEKLGATSAELVLMKTRAENLRLNQDRMNSEMVRVEDKVGKILADQNQFNNNITNQNARMEEQQKMFHQQQDVFNKDLHCRSVALQDKLESTSTTMQLALIRADEADHRHAQISSELTSVDGKLEKFQTEVIEQNARIEEQQKMYLQQQGMLYSKANEICNKQYETETKLELVKHSADILKEEQTKIDLDMREERKINEDRLREQTRYNIEFTKSSTVVEERQNRLMKDLEKLVEATSKIDNVSCRVDNLYSMLEKVTQEQRDKDKQNLETAIKVQVEEHCRRAEQKQMEEQLKSLAAQVSGFEARAKTMEHRLDSLQTTVDRVNELCTKMLTAMSSAGRSDMSIVEI